MTSHCIPAGARGALPSVRLTRQRGLPPAHRATTVELRTLYPFVIPDDLGVDGCYIGREASGRSFCFDPWECYTKGKLTSPNIVVLGQIGRGKSAFVKSSPFHHCGFIQVTCRPPTCLENRHVEPRGGIDIARHGTDDSMTIDVCGERMFKLFGARVVLSRQRPYYLGRLMPC